MARSTGTPKTGRRERQRAATAHNRAPEGATPSPATTPAEPRQSTKQHAAPVVPRGQGGKWLPGRSANPGGRQKVEGYIRELARQHGPEAIQTLARLLKSKKEPIQLGAAECLLNRGYGRPAQAIELSFQREDLAARIAQLTPEEKRRVAAGDLTPLTKA